MSKTEEAIALAKQWAADNSHGYDQSSRWGTDYDCSSFLIAVWEAVGVPVRSSGATYTGNMREVFTRCGFVVPELSAGELSSGAGLRDGDVVLNEANHCAMVVNGGQLVQASANEFGGVTGGVSGDQTGREIGIVNWYSYPWDCALRFEESAAQSGGNSPHQSAAPTASPQGEAKGGTYTVKSGDSWWGIAQKCWGDGSLMYELAKLNGKSVSSVIHPGDIVLLQGSGALDERKKQLEKDVAALDGRIVWE